MTDVTHLGRYELLEQIGEGGMGAVWLARLSGAAGFEKLCIVKTVLPAIARDAEFVSRFLHEGRVLTQLVHGNIAQVLDMNEVDGQLFLALEYVSGVDLSRLQAHVRTSGVPMPLGIAVALLAQAADGLAAAHRKRALDGTPLQVVHRDVSPQNLMVSYEGEVKVIDFGIARSEARSRHTAQASVMGKLGYMAPEQARGEPVDHRADQYALGIVLWELLSNQPFVPRGTVTEMVAAMAMPVVKPLAPLRGDVPASLEAVVSRALAPKPADRFPDTDAFQQALMGELLGFGPPPSKPQIGEYVRLTCSGEFSSQQQLLSRVATQRARPMTNVTPLRTEVDALEATSLRPVATETKPSAPAVVRKEAQAPTAPLPQRGSPAEDVSLNTSELAAAQSRRSPVAVVGGLVALLAVGFGLWWWRTNSEVMPSVPDPVPVAVAVPDASVPVAIVPTVVPAIEPTLDAGIDDAGVGCIELPPWLTMKARRAGGSAWVITNADKVAWKECRLTIPGRRVAVIGTVPRGSSMEVADSRFHVDSAADETPWLLQLDCRDGRSYVAKP